MQPGGQVHLWDPPEFAIKKSATWDPSVKGFATFFARMAIIWENYQQAKRDVHNDDGYEFSAFDKFQHLRNITKAAGTQCKRMAFHQQLREFLKDHPDLAALTEDDLEKFETTCSSEEQDQRNTDHSCHHCVIIQPTPSLHMSYRPTTATIIPPAPSTSEIAPRTSTST